MKKKIIILWSIFAICLVITIALWFAMNKQEISYEEVQVTVLSAKTEEIVNRKTGSRTTFYKVKVRYNGEEYDLENAHNTYMYPQGKTVKAYLSNNRIFADEAGVKTSTPLAITYFTFLLVTFVMLMLIPWYMSKLKQDSKE